MKRILSLLLLFTLLTVCVPVSAEDAGILVKNYKQLVSAVNEQQADYIRISAKYKHGTNEIINLELGGRTVTFLPDKGDSAVINGRVDIVGPGTVVYHNVSVTGPDGDAGLWIGGGADVTIGSVKGGKAKKEAGGCPAVIMTGGTLTVNSAVGSDAKSGFGGDGIYAFGDSTVTVGEAVGGSASKGFGGSGAVVFGGAKVTVTGSAVGGNGLYAAGKGVLTGVRSTAEGPGTVTDGTLLDGKKTLDPDTVSSRVTLEHACRSGRTEILLAPNFRAGAGWSDDLCLFCVSEEPVLIANASEENPATVDCQLYFQTGTWNLDNLRFALRGKDWISCLWVQGDADVTASGSIAAKGEACGIYASESGKITFTGDCTSEYYAVFARGNATAVLNGNITETGRKHFAAGCDNSSSVTVNGDITVSGDSNALVCYDGRLEMTGSILAGKNKDYPVLYISAGEMVLNGPLKCEGQASAIYCKGGSVTVNGDVTDMTKKKYAVDLAKTAGQVTINGTLTAEHTAVRADGGTAVINGDLIIINRDNYALTSWDSENGASVTVTGEGKVVSP